MSAGFDGLCRHPQHRVLAADARDPASPLEAIEGAPHRTVLVRVVHEQAVRLRLEVIDCTDEVDRTPRVAVREGCQERTLDSTETARHKRHTPDGILKCDTYRKSSVSSLDREIETAWSRPTFRRLWPVRARAGPNKGQFSAVLRAPRAARSLVPAAVFGTAKLMAKLEIVGGERCAALDGGLHQPVACSCLYAPRASDKTTACHAEHPK